ncbi:MAG TPA: ABC transporter permease [Rhizomicrobium sp.]|nr:ABC transporter permease [Rhizomicrobium sp.]
MSDSTLPTVRLQPSGRLRFLDLAELWHYRELIYFLTWRDIKVRYKQTAIGVVWAVLQPIALILVFTLFFGRLAKLPSDGVPYPLFAFCALLPWQVFSRSISESANSLVTDQRLISRVYFPRIIVPTASIVGSLMDFAISFLLFLGMMAWYGVTPTANIVFLPVFLMLMMMTALGVGYWLSALNIEYRDVAYALPFLSQIWMFLSPVVYSSSLVPEKYRVLYGLNPMAGVIDGFRWALLGVGPGPSPMLLASVCISVTLFVTGIFWFRGRERTFADAIGSGGR